MNYVFNNVACYQNASNKAKEKMPEQLVCIEDVGKHEHLTHMHAV